MKKLKICDLENTQNSNLTLWNSVEKTIEMFSIFQKSASTIFFSFLTRKRYRVDTLHNRMVLSGATCASTNYMSLSNRNSVS